MLCKGVEGKDRMAWYWHSRDSYFGALFPVLGAMAAKGDETAASKIPNLGYVYTA